MLRQIYGEIILKKDSILYHTSDESFVYKTENEKPFLFCTFHPSEYFMISDYITKIKLKKDTSLFFMIDSLKKAKIYFGLNNITNYPNKNLSKKNKSELIILSNILKKENFDGWFSSIDNNKGTVEAVFINDPNIFEIIESLPLINNWRNGYFNNDVLNIKNWGKKYSVCTINYSALLNINEKYREMIKDYIDFEKESKFINNFVFQVILKNAVINYHI
jgi:hypothetical protein